MTPAGITSAPAIVLHALTCGLALMGLLTGQRCGAAAAVIRGPGGPHPNLEDQIERPLRYHPDGTDFVITNGGVFFNRPLYGGYTSFRADAGDVPEFSLYQRGRCGNLRLGWTSGGQAKWLHEAGEVVARYRSGAMLYEVHDPLLGDGVLKVEAIGTRAAEGLLVRAELIGASNNVELIFAFGGVNGMRGRRDGDIGTENIPISEFFQLRPEQCRDNAVALVSNSFAVRGRPGVIAGVISTASTLSVATANSWSRADALVASANAEAEEPVVLGQVPLAAGVPVVIGVQRLASSDNADEVLEIYREVARQAGGPAVDARLSEAWRPDELGELFNAEEARRRAVAEQIKVETPDPFINAAVPALNIAADAVWDEAAAAFMHGAVAWRVRLLGWRVAYAGDALGWHDRTRRHFEGYATGQNTDPVQETIPPPEYSANLSRNETALHSNGDLTRSHYDMNLVGVDTFFRHLLWTGDLDYARRMWPVIERHLAWERRLFRREFGADKLPLYEAYCCIWASDDVAYNGGGTTHSSAYNYYQNRMAARVAKLIGEDPVPYEEEAELIAKGMRCELWLLDRGWYAEYRDLLGLQQVHPNAAAWTFYHTVDSEVPTPQEAWQMTRFVDTQIARIPLRSPGVPEGFFTMPTSSWMPYSWSVNNVVMGEAMHTALAYWQANRPETGFARFKGAVLDSMFLGLCPGNVGMATSFDAYRGESQRDFGDGIGITSRALVEGLFGVKPDLLAGELLIRPGFPKDWEHASMVHQDVTLRFRREGLSDTYTLQSRFPKPVRLRLEVPALRDAVADVSVNGEAAQWQVVEDSVELPRISIEASPAAMHNVVIHWQGKPPANPPGLVVVNRHAELKVDCETTIAAMSDPQAALGGREDGSADPAVAGAARWVGRSEAQRDTRVSGHVIEGVASGTPGHRTVFAKVEQGDLRWWQPVQIEIREDVAAVDPIDWTKPAEGLLEPVDLTGHFNDRVTQIFRNEYLSPRSPFCSLAVPKQGIGSWCHPADTFEVDDSGLRAAAARSGGRIILPNGVPLATPGDLDANNILFTSQWDNYPAEASVPLSGRASHAFLLMTGSTRAMQSQFDNGEVVVTYTDGSTDRLALRNPATWWPIEQDYFIDDYAFRFRGSLPPRVDLKTGRVRVLDAESFKGQGREVPGGAATVLNLPLNPGKELKSLTVRALANEVVIGLMAVTVAR